MTATETDTIDTFGSRAADAAMRAAAEYIGRKGLKPDAAQLDAVTAAMKRRVPAAVAEGLEDARDAIECGMKDAAAPTFLASVRLAGIEAAKEVLG